MNRVLKYVPIELILAFFLNWLKDTKKVSPKTAEVLYEIDRYLDMFLAGLEQGGVEIKEK